MLTSSLLLQCGHWATLVCSFAQQSVGWYLSVFESTAQLYMI